LEKTIIVESLGEGSFSSKNKTNQIIIKRKNE